MEQFISENGTYILWAVGLISWTAIIGYLEHKKGG